MKKNIDQFKDKSVSELLKLRNSHVKEIVVEKAMIAQSGRKSTNKSRQLETEIAWIETLINQKVTSVNTKA